MTLWLGPWLGRDLTICACEDHVPALAAEREAEWRRVGAADFLTDEEKRRATGVDA